MIAQVIVTSSKITNLNLGHDNKSNNKNCKINSMKKQKQPIKFKHMKT